MGANPQLLTDFEHLLLQHYYFVDIKLFCIATTGHYLNVNGWSGIISDTFFNQKELIILLLYYIFLYSVMNVILE